MKYQKVYLVLQHIPSLKHCDIHLIKSCAISPYLKQATKLLSLRNTYSLPMEYGEFISLLQHSVDIGLLDIVGRVYIHI